MRQENIMSTKHGAALLVIAAIVLATSGTAWAGVITLFDETFESYTGFSSGTNQGIPLESEGADETWYGGRFEVYDTQSGPYSLDYDVAVRYVSGDKYARFEDEAGILFKVNTVGLTEATLSFKWKTHLEGSTDRFVAGYYVGNDLGFDLGANRRRDFFEDFGGFGGMPGSQDDVVAWWSTQWETIIRSGGNGGWYDVVYDLEPDALDQAEVWFAFWMDNGEGDYGKVDDVLLTGIPEPTTMLLLAIGATGLLHRRSKK